MQLFCRRHCCRDAAMTKDVDEKTAVGVMQKLLKKLTESTTNIINRKVAYSHSY